MFFYYLLPPQAEAWLNHTPSHRPAGWVEAPLQVVALNTAGEDSAWGPEETLAGPGYKVHLAWEHYWVPAKEPGSETRGFHSVFLNLSLFK